MFNVIHGGQTEAAVSNPAEAVPQGDRLATAPRVTRSMRRILVGAGLPHFTLTEHPRSGRNRMFVATVAEGRWFAKAGASEAESWFYREVGVDLDWVPASLPLSDPRVTLTDYLDDRPSVIEVAAEKPTQALGVLVSLAPHLAELHGWSRSLRSTPMPAATPALPQLEPVHVLMWLDSTPASCQVLHSIQRRSVLRAALRTGLAGAGPRGLIHADLKGDNILCGATGPMVIDWELCGEGHTAWDIGSVVGSMLAIWLDGVDFQDSAPGAWLEQTVVPYKEIRDATRQLVTDYRTTLGERTPSTATIASYSATWLAVRSWAESLFGHQVNPRHLLRLIVAEGLVRNPTVLLGSWPA